MEDLNLYTEKDHLASRKKDFQWSSPSKTSKY